MSETQQEYVINPNYQQWVLDQDAAEDEYTPCTDHRHEWHLIVDVFAPTDDGCFENVITAWCQCGKELSQDEIEAILNRSAQP